MERIHAEKLHDNYIKQWLRFCQRSGHAASSPSAGSLIAFLLELHREGRAYLTINSARSAISTLYSLDGNRLGEHPIVRRFMTGVRNLTPPVPKYPTFWKPESLLRFLKNWEVQANNLKEVSLKLVTTIACLSVHASADARAISTDTVSRWVRQTLSRASIDTQVFGAHSVRGASASAALGAGAPLDTILQAGDWPGLSAYSKHYQRRTFTLPATPRVANALLNCIR